MSRFMSEQLELFEDTPFSLRLRIEDAMGVFWSNYWRFLPTSRTTKAHRKRILKHFEGRFIDTLSKTDIEDFRRSLAAQGLSQATVNHAHMLLSRMFSKLQDYKEGGMAHGVDYSRIAIPDKNPCTSVPKVKAVKRRQIITPEEWKRLKYHADDDMTDILSMLLWTRLRPGDLRRITSANVDLKRGRIEGIQNKTITTRNPSGLPYMVPIVQKIADILLPRLAKTKPGSPLFPFRNLQKRWKELREKAGLQHIQLGRDLRRTAPTLLLDSGVDPLTVAEGLGHASLDMLPTYTPRSYIHQEKSTEIIVESFP